MGKKINRPWGYYEVLAEASNHKVKKIVVEPNGRLSLQSHKLRREHWFVVAGHGRAVVDGTELPLCAGSVIDIPALARHRVQNSSTENLIIIEVQTGEYFGEDDIERFEDDYGRT
ncbi:MAG: phosphomannose isomerase type II C-terminal cupin domain [Smithellaceae bacterium]